MIHVYIVWIAIDLVECSSEQNGHMISTKIASISTTNSDGFGFSCSRGDVMNIQNVFAICRPSEKDQFRSDLESRPLFHASNVENFVGILSR